MQFTSENLVSLLDKIKELIQEEKMLIDDQEQLWNMITWDKNDPANEDAIKYLFTGWWMHYITDSK